MTKLTLAEWAAENYRSPPSPNTLRKWAREGRIIPTPIKHGRTYYLDASSQYLEPEMPRARSSGDTLVDRITAARGARRS
ncbi:MULTISPECIES: excisionase [Pseudomonas]|uniref:excisionase n=1 Tax=Pseudomonas TaxID=286 RepID=UPI001B4D4D4C|nr:excisionase [Pseudomonas sp.]MBP6953033.1 excisionase [Pseudomonas sp.]MDE1529629.1 excisionase [Pseudomonas carnis]